MWGEPIKKKKGKKRKAKLSVWQWSDLVTMPLTLTEHSVIGGKQYYLIIVSDDGATLNCIARYSELLDFKEAHSSLTTLAFPPKLFPLIAPSPSDLSQRRTQLELWMQAAYNANRKIVQNFVQAQFKKHERKMAGSPPASPTSSPISPSDPPPPGPVTLLYDPTVYDDLIPDTGKTSMYITDMVELKRYDSVRQKFTGVAYDCRLRNAMHQQPQCIYSIDNQELVVFFAPWERNVSLRLLTDILGTNEKLSTHGNMYHTVMLGNKFYLLYDKYFVSYDVISFEVDRLPFPPRYVCEGPMGHHGYPLIAGAGKRIHLVDKKAKVHAIFNTESKVWISTTFPPGLDNHLVILPRAIISKGCFYIFSSKISMRYFPDTAKWEPLPLPPIKDYPFMQIANDPATNDIWIFDGFGIYSFNTSTKIWTPREDIPMMDSKKTVAKIGTLFFSSVFESGNVSKLEELMSAYISQGPVPWKELYRQDKLNDTEESLINEFEHAPLPEKVMIFKKSQSEYLPMFDKFFRKRTGFDRICDLIWQLCKEEPSFSQVLYEQITDPYWTQVFTRPVDNSFTFITKKQKEEVNQSRLAAAQAQAARLQAAAAAQSQPLPSSSSAPPSAPPQEPPPEFTPEMEASLIELTEKTANIARVLEGKFIIPPQEFVCPITQQIMLDPVTTRDGHNYERLAIIQWFSRGNKKSPLTNQDLPDYSLVTPFSLKTLIQDFLEKNGVSV